MRGVVGSGSTMGKGSWDSFEPPGPGVGPPTMGDVEDDDEPTPNPDEVMRS
jgi:hypothetical protein